MRNDSKGKLDTGRKWIERRVKPVIYLNKIGKGILLPEGGWQEETPVAIVFRVRKNWVLRHSAHQGSKAERSREKLTIPWIETCRPTELQDKHRGQTQSLV